MQVDDAAQYYDEIKARLDTMASPAPPLFIGGNSLGGLVASHLALARPTVVGLIMQSPAIDVEWNAVLK